MEETNEKYKKRPVKTKKRRKAKRRVRPGCLISVAALFFAFVLLFLTPVFNITKIEVEGNESVKTSEIVSASGINKNKNIFSVNLGKAKEKVLKVPYVESVKITRKLPKTIEIKVTEGKVVSYIQWDKKLVGISESGQVLCIVSKVPATRKAPVVKGITIKSECVVGKKVEVRESVRYETLMRFVKTFEDRNMTEDITVFDITKTEYISIMHRDKLKIEFGSTTDYEHKFSFIEALTESMGKDVEGELNMVSENYTYGHTLQ